MNAVSACLVLLILGEVGKTDAGCRSILEDRYRAVSAAIVAEDLEAIAAMGYRSFAASAEDLRSIWQANFQMVAEYGPVAFELVDVMETGNDLVAVVDRRIFFRFEGTTEQQFEQGRSRDRWTRTDGHWRLVNREEIGERTHGQVLPDAGPVSPRLRQLQSAIERGQSQAIPEFWAEVSGKCPLVEPLSDEPSQRLVTFLWRDDAATEQVEVRGVPDDPSCNHFGRLPESDVWYKSVRLPSDSRFIYVLIVRRRIAHSEDGEALREGTLVETYPLDPLNPLVFNAGSVLELPDAPRDMWHVAREKVPRGRVERHRIESKRLGETRSIRVYVSSRQGDPSMATALAVFLDGEDSEDLMSLPTVCDNLVADGKISPLVAVLVDSHGTRGKDLNFNDSFIDFLADELIPWVSKHCGAHFQPDRTVIGGLSLGGLAATYAGCQRPDTFRNVLSQSGAFWRRRPDRSDLPEGWLPGEIAKGSSPKVRFYLEVGRFESPSMVENNRRMRDVLIAKGCKVHYSEYHGGHDHVNWRVSVGKGLIALLGEQQ